MACCQAQTHLPLLLADEANVGRDVCDADAEAPRAQPPSAELGQPVHGVGGDVGAVVTGQRIQQACFVPRPERHLAQAPREKLAVAEAHKTAERAPDVSARAQRAKEARVETHPSLRQNSRPWRVYAFSSSSKLTKTPHCTFGRTRTLNNCLPCTERR